MEDLQQDQFAQSSLLQRLKLDGLSGKAIAPECLCGPCAEEAAADL